MLKPDYLPSFTKESPVSKFNVNQTHSFHEISPLADSAHLMLFLPIFPFRTTVNESSDGKPKNLNWKFLRGGYSTLIADGGETDFKISTRQPFKLRFRASLGANMSQYARPAAPNRFLANLNVASAQGKTQMLPGTEAAISVGMLFPSAPMCLNFELGMAYRKVDVQGSFYTVKTATQSVRDGQYRNYNYYLAVVPEVFLGQSGTRHDVRPSVSGTSVEPFAAQLVSSLNPWNEHDQCSRTFTGYIHRF
jgi:hypothetical protein